MKKIKINKINLIKYFLIFIMFLVLTNARGYSVSPFSVGALFALMWCGLYLPVIAGEYLFANIILMNKLADIYSAITTVFILLLVYFIHKRIKKPMNVILVGLYTLFSQIVSVYYIYNIGGWLDCITFMVLAVISAYVCISIFQAMILRKGVYRLTLDERIGVVSFIVVISLGLADIYICGYALYKFIVAFVVMMCVAKNKKIEAIIIAMSIGLGVSIYTTSLASVGEMVILAIAGNIFGAQYKYKTAGAMILGYCVSQIYFVGFKYELIYSVLPICLGIGCYLVCANYLKLEINFINTGKQGLSARNVVGCAKRTIKRRMEGLSDVFAQMAQIHLKMVQEQLTKSQLTSLIVGDVAKTICADCKNRQNCYKLLGKDDCSNLEQLIGMAIDKGKVSILDLPSPIAQKCGMVNILIGKINQLISEYGGRLNLINETNQVKFLLSEHSGEISKLLLNLSKDLDKEMAFDENIQDKIINNLLKNNIICDEVLIFGEKQSNIAITAIIKGDGAYNPVLEKTIGKSLGIAMVIESVEPSEIGGCYSVTLVTACRQDVAFGIACRTKTGSTNSGDSHSLIRLGGNKYLLALCDGMGSGDRAREMSVLTMSLVESFYRAGFDDGFILNNINKLLSVNNGEEFSTLDLCVLDLNKDSADFIKLGSAISVIKRESSVDFVDAGSLPLGVLSQIKVGVSHFAITNKDMIIMVTDGITDAFSSEQKFMDFVNSIVGTNPQMVAQAILDEAILLNSGIAKDDMTVLVARTFLKG